MNDFFSKLAGKNTGDRIPLLLTLYDCYKKLNPGAESLDEFIFWGGVLLSDFDDVDKYLVDADRLFTNIGDYRSMQDSFEYLSETQREAIMRLVGHFSSGEKEYKERFRRIWDLLLLLYKEYNEALEQKGISYEGRVYRSLAERLKSESVADIVGEKFGGTELFVFVGLNVLNECEKRLLGKLRDARLAEFCWDYCGGYIRTPENKSSLFMEENVANFQQAFELEKEGLDSAAVNFLSVPSGIGQVKRLPEILKRLPSPIDEKTAVVLPDEGLLLPLLNSIPEDIKDINVTMGYPLGGSEISTLVSDVAALQLHMRGKEGKWSFYHSPVHSVLSNSLIKSVLSEEGKQISDKVRKDAKYYVSEDEFAADPLLKSIFRPVAKDLSSNSGEQTLELAEYIQNLLYSLGRALLNVEDMALELDFAREYYHCASQLKENIKQLLPATWFRLLKQLCAGATVPFKGEPLKGLQIMGPLETRALDFDNLIIMSCNEGVFPRRSSGASFIPPELRRAFGLPGYEYQDAVWAYYFYRLIQRCKNLWLVYDSRGEGLKSGEVSRYVQQLQLHFKVNIKKWVANEASAPGTEPLAIQKTQEDIEKIRSKEISVSRLQDYLSCPAMFYYGFVRELYKQDEVNESLDAGTLGDVMHKVMQTLYQDKPGISMDYLSSLLDKPEIIRKDVQNQIKLKLKCEEIEGRNLIYEDVIFRYVKIIIQSDINNMKRHSVSEFRVFGLERNVRGTLCGLRFKGTIDRLDSFSEGSVRVVDYKSGHVSDNEVFINDDNAPDVVKALFTKKGSDRPKIALQLYVYDELVKQDRSCAEIVKGKRLVNSIYHPPRMYGRGVEESDVSEVFRAAMESGLQGLVDTILNPDIPFNRSGEAKTCEFCDFKQLCGK
ncbi:MAG: PD-(D/E)XK nuclease family protein [Bacteroidales bacterium]|nr:PD-(D/E)XK nuclease family protein [Bacteroidales bacterium]